MRHIKWADWGENIYLNLISFYLLSFTVNVESVLGSISSSMIHSKLTSSNGFFTGPYLDGRGVFNVTTQIGTHAYLPCKVWENFYSSVVNFKSCLYLCPIMWKFVTLWDGKKAHFLTYVHYLRSHWWAL